MFTHAHLPPLGEATEWLNSEPLGPAELTGHVVVVNFWTLTCISWLRQQPYVRAWSHAYRDKGLIVIGVHTPEFSFECHTDLVRQATTERKIDYPVAVDDDYSIWNAFNNHAWPALYFVDADGVIRDAHVGEGRYEKSERLIQRLLGIDQELVSVAGTGVEAEADCGHLRTPETYLGYLRMARFSSPTGPAMDRPRLYDLTGGLRPSHWSLSGAWTIRAEHVASEQPGCSIVSRFHARDAHLVLDHATDEPLPFRVRLDGRAPGESRGVDVDEDGNGVLQDGRLYQLVRVRDAIRERMLEVTFLERGARAYAFTFG